MNALRAAILGASLLLSCCAHDSTISQRDNPDLDRRFVPDVQTGAALEVPAEVDLRDIAVTLPIFEVAPDMRREWVYRAGIEERNHQEIRYKCDGACPAPTIRLLSSRDPIRIEVSFQDGSRQVKYCYKRADGGWRRLVGCINGVIPRSEQVVGADAVERD